MADYVFTAYLDQSLDNSRNWNNADSSGNDLGTEASNPPGPGDNAWFGSIGADSGTLTCNNLNLTGIVTFSGGTYNIQNLIYDNWGSTYSGGTWNVPMTFALSSTISGGTFNADVEIDSAYATLSGGDFMGNLTYTVAPTSGVAPNSVYGLLTIPLSLDASKVFGQLFLQAGGTYFYGVNSTGVAPADKVLTGTSNLGVDGTASAGIPSGFAVSTPTGETVNGTGIPYMVATPTGATLVTP